jgi:hypothetical protein
MSPPAAPSIASTKCASNPIARSGARHVPSIHVRRSVRRARLTAMRAHLRVGGSS